MSPPVHVLVVDDDPHMARHVGLLARLAGDERWAVTATHSAQAALDAIRAHEPGRAKLVLVTDFNLGGGATGADLLRAAKARDPGAGVILMSGEHPSAFADAIREPAPDAVLEKPFSIETMQASLLGAATR